MIAPITGTIRLLITGNGAERRVKVFLTTQQRELLRSASARR